MMLHRSAMAITAFSCAYGWFSLKLGRQVLAPTRAAARAKVVTLSPSAKAELSLQLNNAVQREDTPGVVAAVVGTDGLLFIGAAGKSDVAQNRPMSTDAIFSIASMTKPITSVAIMMLVEQDQLKLEDPLSKYLTGFENLQVITNFNENDATYTTRPARGPITIRHLMTHTSGIAYSFSNAIENRLVKGTKKDEWEFPLLNDPGARWTYGPSTRLLGMIIEKITGLSLEAFFQQKIFVPLGMPDTSFAVPFGKQDRVPTMHRRVEGAMKESRRTSIPTTAQSPFTGDGGLYSTVEDYAKFVQMLLNGGRATSHASATRILRESSVKQMGENNIGAAFVEQQTDAEKTLTRLFPIGAGRDKFGLGFQITAADPQYVNYRSPGSLSWAGIFNTEFWVDPAKHVGGIQMMQVLPFYDQGAIRTLRQFEAAVYRNLR